MTKISQFGALLNRYMEVADTTPGRLAGSTPLSRATIYNWISGRSARPRHWQDVLALADGLRLTAEQTDELLRSANFPAKESLPNETETTVRPKLTTRPTLHQGQMVGVTWVAATLVDWLTDPVSERIVSIEGIGGVGKTTLAVAVMQALEAQTAFAEILWITAKHEAFAASGKVEALPNSVRTVADVTTCLTELLGQKQWMGLSSEEQIARIRPILADTPHLIVIDNLETLTDVELLLPTLAQLTAPTCILLTSRQSLQHFPYVRCYRVAPLSIVESQQLIVHEVARRGSRLVVSEQQMQAIFTLVGGLPLALKLIAAQLSFLPLSIVLHDFQSRQTTSPGEMYSFIYYSAWRKLGQSAKVLLLSLLDNTIEGETYSWVEMMSGLPQHDCVAALRELLDYSLLEITTQEAGHRYALHRMTSTFLETIILAQRRDAANAVTTRPFLTAEEERYWLRNYQRRQRHSLQQLKHQLDNEQMHEVGLHFASVLTLFNHSRPQPDCQNEIIALIEQLHPWPVRWGAWKGWQAQLEFALMHYERTGDSYQFNRYQLHLATLQLKFGLLGTVVTVCEQVRAAATANDWILLQAQAGELEIQALRELEQLSRARELLAELNRPIGTAIVARTTFVETIIARIYLALQQMYFLRSDGRTREAVTLGSRIIQTVADYPSIERQLVANCHHAYGVALWGHGDYAASIGQISHARDLFDSLEDRVEAIIMRDSIGLVYWSMGQLAQAEQVMRESLQMMRDLNAQADVVRLVGNLAVVYMANGEITQAIQYLKEQKRLATITNAQREASRAEHNLSSMLLCQEKYAEAIPLKEKLLHDGVEPLSKIAKMVTLAELSDAYCALGEREKAATYGNQITALRGDVDTICAEIFALRAVAHLQSGASGHAMLQEAAQVAQSSGRRLDLAACQLDMIAFANSEAEMQQFWDLARETLTEIDALAWLRGRTIENVPRLPYLY